MITSSIGGERELAAALAKAARKLDVATEAGEAESAEALATDMRGRAPVLSGELRDGIKVVEQPDGSRGVGPVGVDHAVPVEFGTSTMSARPYATPAAEAERSRLPGRVAGQVKKAGLR